MMWLDSSYAPIKPYNGYQTVIEKIVTELKLDEGYRQYVYKDTVGVSTVGYGTNLEKRGLSLVEAEYLLRNDVKIIIEKLHANYSFFEALSDARKCALINLAYNVGWTGFTKFKTTLKHIEAGDFAQAKLALLNSKAARQHAQWKSQRYVRLGEQLVNG